MALEVEPILKRKQNVDIDGMMPLCASDQVLCNVWSYHFYGRTLSTKNFDVIIGPYRVKKCLRTFAKCTEIQRMRKVSSDVRSPFIHSAVSDDYISGQWRPWSDCADVRADLDLRCLSHARRHVFAWQDQLQFIYLFIFLSLYLFILKF